MKKFLLFLMFAMFCIPWAANAQETLTVHDGAATNGNVPVYGYYADAYLKCEMVYPAAELGDMEGGTITSMTFYATTPATDSWGSANFQVFLTEVADATISAYVGPGTIVYEGALDGTQSEITITFTTPYVYNGGNLLVGVYNTVIGSYKSITWAGEEVTGASITGYSYNSLDGVSASQRNFLPKTTFEYTPGSGITCNRPTNVAVSYEGSIATATWDGEVSLYNIDVNGTVTNGVTSPYTFALEPNTTYSVKVQADCGNDDLSSWAVAPSFTTPCAAFTLPYAYGFEDAGDLNCWDMVYTANTPGINTDQAHTGSNCFRFSSYSSASSYDQYLISPMFNATNGIDFSFYYKPYNYGTEVFNVGYSTTTNEASAFIWSDDITTTAGTDWDLYEATYPAGTKYVAIYYHSNFAYYLYVDDFNFEVPSSCRKPSNLTVSEVGKRTATLSWIENGEATAWNLMVNGELIENVTNPYTLTGLTPETSYTVQVSPVCEVEKWSDAITFTTLELCPEPTNVAVSDITPMSANVSWTGTASSYNLRYRTARGFHYDFETATPWVEDNFAPCTTYDGDGLTTYQISDWTPLGTYQFVGSMMTLQSGVTDFASAHGGELFGGFVAGIPTDDVEHNDDYFILPSITIENGYVFEFWASSLLNNWGLERMRVGVYGGNGTITEYLAGSATDYVEVPNGWTKYSYDLSGFAGQTIQLAINSLCPDAYILGIDDIFVGDPNEDTWDVTLNDVTSPYALTGLTEETMYEVQVQAACGEDGESAWVGITFTTPSKCDAPSALESTDVMPHSASLNWTGYQDSYTVRYRTAAHSEAAAGAFFEDFESASLTTNGWTVLREGEGTEYTDWRVFTPASFDDENVTAHSGDYVVMGRSWSSSAYSVDNWLISPQVTLDGELSYWVLDDGQYHEHYDVYVSTTTTETSAFTLVYEPGDASNEWIQHTVDLSSYAGQQGYIAFRLTDSDQDFLFLDDITLGSVVEVPAGEWIEVEVSALPYTLEDLEDETEYEWQVQGINASCDGGMTAWSEIGDFTTPSACDVPVSLVAEVDGTTATLSWTGYQESFNLTYGTPATYDILIATGDAFDGYYDWTPVTEDEESDFYQIGSEYLGYGFSSTSTPQYLISPEFEALEGNSFVEFLYYATDEEIPETFQIGYSMTDNEVASFTWGDVITVSDVNYYDADLPEGAKYFAIKYTSDHPQDSTLLLFLDFTLVSDYVPAGEVVTLTNVTSPVTITGLDPETTYNWQVEGISEDCTGALTSEVATFITGEQAPQTIALSAGTNWVSFNVETNLDELKTALLATGNTAITIQGQSQNATYNPNNGRWTGQLRALDLSQMYKIKVADACDITLEGKPVDPSMYSITIAPGVNYIAYPFNTNMTVTDAFAGFGVDGDVVQSQLQNANYNGTRWNGQLRNLEPGKGYIYKSASTETRVFNYPTSR